MSVHKCCVPNCGTTRTANITLHLFPNPDKDIDRFRTWVYAVGSEILALENSKIFKLRRVCHAHFEPRYYTISNRLAANAVPTINLSGKGVIDKECQDTADVILFFDNLFDSLNGSYLNSKKKTGKALLGPVRPKSIHKKVWRDAKQVLRTMKFVKNGKSAVVPSITNWLQSIENIEYLVEQLEKQHDFFG